MSLDKVIEEFVSDQDVRDTAALFAAYLEDRGYQIVKLKYEGFGNYSIEEQLSYGGEYRV